MTVTPSRTPAACRSLAVRSRPAGTTALFYHASSSGAATPVIQANSIGARVVQGRGRAPSRRPVTCQALSTVTQRVAGGALQPRPSSAACRSERPASRASTTIRRAIMRPSRRFPSGRVASSPADVASSIWRRMSVIQARTSAGFAKFTGSRNRSRIGVRGTAQGTTVGALRNAVPSPMTPYSLLPQQ
jgi:hypothetical protein